MSNRAASIAVVLAVAVGIVLVREPLVDMFDGNIEFNLVGAGVFVGLLLASLVAVVMVHRARAADPAFRGVVSEATRLVAIGEAALLAIAWALYLFAN